MDTFGSIYIIENDINDKVYIGQTTQNIRDRFNEHINNSRNKYSKMKLHEAMRSIGAEHFRIRKLRSCKVGELNDLEKYYIKLYDSNKNGYNSAPGGAGIKQRFGGLKIDEFEGYYNDRAAVTEISQNIRLFTVNELLDTNIDICSISNDMIAGKKLKAITYSDKITETTHWWMITYISIMYKIASIMYGKGIHDPLDNSKLTGDIIYELYDTLMEQAWLSTDEAKLLDPIRIGNTKWYMERSAHPFELISRAKAIIDNNMGCIFISMIKI